MISYKDRLRTFLDEVLKRAEISSLDRVISDLKRARYVCVFGIGAISYPIISAIRSLTNIRIDFVSDNDPGKWGHIYHGDLPCKSPEDLKQYEDDLAILITTQHYKEIYSQLAAKGFRNLFVLTEYRLMNKDFFKDRKNLQAIRKHATALMDILEDERSKEILLVLIQNWFDFSVEGDGYQKIFSTNQYYPDDVIRLRPDESFVDAGAYDGDTLLEFINKSRGQFNKIHAFELDAANYEVMQKNIEKLEPHLSEKIKLHPAGLLDEEIIVHYETGGSGKQSTCINMLSETSCSGKTVRLDDVLKQEAVTFIKMDIEGAELKALQGAADIISRQKPKLAICVYHKPHHLWEIPFYIKHLVPEYKIYLRHHTPLEYETVCYAVTDSFQE